MLRLIRLNGTPQVDPTSSIFTDCLPYVGNILMCLEEGVGSLPPPVRNFRAVTYNATAVTLVWDGVEDKKDKKEEDESPDIDRYEVYYKMIKNDSRDADDFLGNQVEIRKFGHCLRSEVSMGNVLI